MPKTSTAKKTTTKKTAVKEKAVPVKAEPIREEKPQNDTISMQFSPDPSYPPDYQYFEIIIDGVFYCYPRGEVVEIPRKIYDIVKEREDNLRRSRASYAAYTRPEGANIT